MVRSVVGWFGASALVCAVLTGCGGPTPASSDAGSTASSTPPAQGTVSSTSPTSTAPSPTSSTSAARPSAPASPSGSASSSSAPGTATSRPSESATAATAATAPAPCANGDLATATGRASAGMGHVGVVLVFTNTSAHACTLFGYPGVAALDAAGRQVSQAVRTRSGYLGGGYALRQVQLAPGGKASTVVEGSDVPSGDATSCPTYPKLLVTAPGLTRSTPVSTRMPGCSPLQVHPVVPGSTGRP